MTRSARLLKSFISFLLPFFHVHTQLTILFPGLPWAGRAYNNYSWAGWVVRHQLETVHLGKTLRFRCMIYAGNIHFTITRSY